MPSAAGVASLIWSGTQFCATGRPRRFCASISTATSRWSWPWPRSSGPTIRTVKWSANSQAGRRTPARRWSSISVPAGSRRFTPTTAREVATSGSWRSPRAGPVSTSIACVAMTASTGIFRCAPFRCSRKPGRFASGPVSTPTSRSASSRKSPCATASGSSASWPTPCRRSCGAPAPMVSSTTTIAAGTNSPAGPRDLAATAAGPTSSIPTIRRSRWRAGNQPSGRATPTRSSTASRPRRGTIAGI